MPPIKEKFGTLFVYRWVFHVRDNIVKYNQHIPTIPLIAWLYLFENPAAIETCSPIELVLDYGIFIAWKNIVLCWSNIQNSVEFVCIKLSRFYHVFNQRTLSRLRPSKYAFDKWSLKNLVCGVMQVYSLVDLCIYF